MLGKLMENIVKTIVSLDGEFRVHFFQRTNGSFGFEQEHFSRHPEELCWIPYGHRPVGFYDTLERVVDEAAGHIDWLKEAI